MTIPASLTKNYTPIVNVKTGKFKRLLVGTDGWSNTGKSEFALSAPGPIIWLCLDRGHEALLDNPRPPATRNKDVVMKVFSIPMATQKSQADYVSYWKEVFYPAYLDALAHPDARTIVLDTDSDSWELQRLAEFGRLTQVPALAYPNINAARKAMITRAFDSGKIVIGINKLEEEYESKLDKDNKPVQVKTGKTKRQGFRDWQYLWQVHLRHMRNAENEFGTQILMAKADTSLAGMELWNEENNFASMVQTIYPQIKLSEWGF